MLIRVIYKIRRWCDNRIEQAHKKTWVPFSSDHNDRYCSHCGYMCQGCGRPL